MSPPLLEVEGLECEYRDARGALRAVRGVSFTVSAGETLALVGESGSGKTSVARAIVGLLRPARGRVRFDGTDLATTAPAALRQLRRRFQMVFQDPYASLNPRHTVGEAVGEGLEIHGIGEPSARAATVSALLDEVGIDPTRAGEYPSAFSGGERQRIALARALAVGPELLVLDEPVSALDVLVRAEILELLARLRRARRLAGLFIGHDLSIVGAVADRVAVMYAGRIVEEGPAAAVLGAPSHPYAAALRSAVPAIDPGARRPRILLSGAPWDARSEPAGCPFAPRCWLPARDGRCDVEAPQLRPVAGRLTACHHVTGAA